MKKVVLIGTFLTSVLLLNACGGGNEPGVTVDVNPKPKATPTATPTPTDSPLVTPTPVATATPAATPTPTPDPVIEANVAKLLAVTLDATASEEEATAKTAAIYAAADQYHVNLANPKLNGGLVRMLVKINDDLQTQSTQISDYVKTSDLSNAMLTMKNYKSGVRTMINVLLPNVIMEETPDDGEIGAEFYKQGGIVGLIYDIIIEAIIQAGRAISYQVTIPDSPAECYGLYRIGELENNKANYPDYVQCEDIMKNPLTINVNLSTTSVVDQIKNDLINNKIKTAQETIKLPLQ